MSHETPVAWRPVPTSLKRRLRLREVMWGLQGHRRFCGGARTWIQRGDSVCSVPTAHERPGICASEGDRSRAVGKGLVCAVRTDALTSPASLSSVLLPGCLSLSSVLLPCLSLSSVLLPCLSLSSVLLPCLSLPSVPCPPPRLSLASVLFPCLSLSSVLCPPPRLSLSPVLGRTCVSLQHTHRGRDPRREN